MTQPIYQPFYHTGTGTTPIYAFGFYISSAQRLYVLTTDTAGVETVLTFGVDYTVTFNNGTSGTGFITLLAGNLATGTVIALHNLEELTQDTQIRNQGDYFPGRVEDAIDKLTRIDQQLQVSIAKSIRLPDGTSEQEFDVELPSNLSENAGAALIVNPTGDGFILGLPTGGSLSGVTDTSTIDLTLASNILSGDVQPDSITNGYINSAAAIARSKLAAGTANRLVQNANSTGAMSDAAAITAARALISDANGIPTHSAVTSTTLAFLDASSSIQTQLDAMVEKAGDTMTGLLTLSGAPSSSLHAATKAYVDAQAAGNVHWTTAVRVATTANGTLATAFDNGSTIDGVVLATGDRILIKDQTAADENGIYIVEAAGAPTRATDCDAWDAELVGIAVGVTAGTVGIGTSWLNTNVDGGTFGVDDVTFIYYPVGSVGDAGNGLQKVGTTFSVLHDGTTLSSSASGLKVAAGGLTNTEVNASAAIAHSKMAALTANMALASDGSGVVAATAVTATEQGYLGGVTGPIQTALDARISKSLLTTIGDIIYASGVSTPARLGIGTNGQVLTLTGGIPAWEDSTAAGQSISESFFRGSTTAGSESLTMNAWTSFTLAAVALSSGSPFTRSVNDLTAPFTGKYTVEINIPKVELTGGTSGAFGFRVRNVTTGATVCNLIPNIEGDPAGPVQAFGAFAVTNTAHVFQVQYYMAGSGGSAAAEFSNSAVGGETPPRWEIYLGRLGS